MARTCTVTTTTDADEGLRRRATTAAYNDLLLGSPEQLHSWTSSVPKQVPVVPAKQLLRSNSGDAAGGPAKVISLSNTGFLARFCTCIPFLLLWSGLIGVVVCSMLCQSCFYVLTAVLSIFTMSYSCDLSVSSLIGAWRMRKAASEDWHAKLVNLVKDRPELQDVMHIVFLPNYKEDEHMLLRTLEQIAASPMAKRSIKVVLAMEAREGPTGENKAASLIRQTKHLFADIFATFHPPNLPGDLTGKSSNTQWAYRQMLKHYSADLVQRDISRVLLSVGDADTLWHPQYFSALAYTALSMPVEQRCWSFFQAPMLLLRNLETVPAMTRVSGYATLLFELAGLTNQSIAPAFCYSSYSLTLALANHSQVNGWDADVIAEDHHMFCKCFFASIRAAEGKTKMLPSAPQTRVEPIYLPSTAFLVESEDYASSCHARFQQACRHSQGVAELSYTCLQYISLIREFGIFALPRSAHCGSLAILYKMIAVHMVNQVEALAVILATALALPGLLSWLITGGVSELLGRAAQEGLASALGQQTFGGLARWSIFSIFGTISPVLLLMICTSYVVLVDLLEGKLTRRRSETAGVQEEVDVGRDVQGFIGKSTNFWFKFSHLARISFDYVSWAHCTLIFYGLLPIMISTTKLLRNGQNCEYIVAAKPK